MTEVELVKRLECLERDNRRLKAFGLTVLMLAVALALFGSAQAQTRADQHLPKAQQRNSGPLTFATSDVNPKTLFWTQGRFVPVDNPSFRGDAEVATVLCSVREFACIEVDGESELPHVEEAWVQVFKVANWDKSGILAASRSLDGCTDETLKIRFAPPSIVLVNSPVLPMSEPCKNMNNAWDKLVGKKGAVLKGQLEQDMLVPTRGFLSWQDTNLK
jgi:hypothetical protein